MIGFYLSSNHLGQINTNTLSGSRFLIRSGSARAGSRAERLQGPRLLKGCARIMMPRVHARAPARARAHASVSAGELETRDRQPSWSTKIAHVCGSVYRRRRGNEGAAQRSRGHELVRLSETQRCRFPPPSQEREKEPVGEKVEPLKGKVGPLVCTWLHNGTSDL